VLPPALDDPVNVPVREILLLDVLGHQRRIDLEHVLEATHDQVIYAVGLWRPLS
jgi:hypothetical protein